MFMKLSDCVADFIRCSNREYNPNDVISNGIDNAKAIGLETISFSKFPTVASLAKIFIGERLSEDIRSNLKVNCKDVEPVSNRALGPEDVTEDGFIFIRSGKKHVLISKILS